MIFRATLVVCLLVAVEQTSGCSSDSDCPGPFDSSTKTQCCPGRDVCCTFTEYFDFTCSSNSDCPRTFDGSDEQYCCPNDRCCTYSDYGGCTTSSDCPAIGDSSDKTYCCSSDKQCCTLNQYFGYECSSDNDCDSGYSCYLNSCEYDGALTTQQIIGIACGVVAFLIFIVLLPICICCCCVSGNQGSSKSRVTTTTVMNPGVVMQPVPPPQTFQMAQPPQNIYSTGGQPPQNIYSTEAQLPRNIYSTGALPPQSIYSTAADYSYSNSAFQGPPMPQPQPYIPPSTENY